MRHTSGTIDDRSGFDGEETCPRCFPFPCDCEDWERPEAVDPAYTPLRNAGCRCGADFTGRDCMCFEGVN